MKKKSPAKRSSVSAKVMYEPEKVVLMVVIVAVLAVVLFGAFGMMR